MWNWLKRYSATISPLDIVQLPEIKRLLKEPVEHMVMVNPETGAISHMATGTFDSVTPAKKPSDYIKHAANVGSKKVILVHNHPTHEDGFASPEPSYNDLQVTERVVEVFGMVGIDLVDHLIVSEAGVYSYRFQRIFR